MLAGLGGLGRPWATHRLPAAKPRRVLEPAPAQKLQSARALPRRTQASHLAPPSHTTETDDGHHPPRSHEIGGERTQ